MSFKYLENFSENYKFLLEKRKNLIREIQLIDDTISLVDTNIRQINSVSTSNALHYICEDCFDKGNIKVIDANFGPKLCDICIKVKSSNNK